MALSRCNTLIRSDCRAGIDNVRLGMSRRTGSPAQLTDSDAAGSERAARSTHAPADVAQLVRGLLSLAVLFVVEFVTTVLISYSHTWARVMRAPPALLVFRGEICCAWPLGDRR